MSPGRTIRTRRRELGISQRELARELGLTTTSMRGVEEDVSFEMLPVRRLRALCEALAIAPSDLLGGPAEPAQTPPGAPSPSEVGALLAKVGGPLPLDSLCDALDATRDEVHAVLASLDQDLRRSGLRVLLRDKTAHLVPSQSHVDPGRVEACLRMTLEREGPRRDEAAAVYAVLSGPRTARSFQGSNHQRVLLGRLANAGILVVPRRETDQVQLSDDVRESLLLDDPPADGGQEG